MNRIEWTSRITGLLLAVAVAATGQLTAEEPKDGGLIKDQASPRAKIHSINHGSVHWTEGFWAQRFDTTAKVTLPALWDLAVDPEAGHAWQNMRIAAGLEEGKSRGSYWQDAWLYKWVESASYVYQVAHDAKLDARMDEVIDPLQPRFGNQRAGAVRKQLPSNQLLNRYVGALFLVTAYGGAVLADDKTTSVDTKSTQVTNKPKKQPLRLGSVTVKVNSKNDGRPVPARITVVDGQGRLVELHKARTRTNAVRNGILYTLGMGDTFSLPAGKYQLYVTRGMEWGVAKQSITVVSGQSQIHTLVIDREVETRGFVASDSHIHTLPGSGHGDATYEERMITIAGEGIEVAIATDHNHISDYGKPQRATGTQHHFHAISGDEVTTRNGHFTAFPLDSAKAVPGGVQGKNPLFLKASDWVKLIADMREKGARVVILNHPYWPTIEKGPYGVYSFDRRTGSSLTGPEFDFNGIEVAQPANHTPNPFYALDDWLALLNRGAKLTAVGASDTHRVIDPVGMARCYLESPTDEVAKIDREDIYRAYVEGRASVAVGIFAKLSITEQYTMGDLAPASKIAAANRKKPGKIELQLRVAAPSWVQPQKAMIYVNGRRVAQRSIDAVTDQPTDKILNFAIDLPPYDAHVVAFVLGDKIKLPGLITVGGATQAITNPIFLDVDNDEKYSSPRETAQRLINELKGDQSATLTNSKKVKSDPAVELHVKDLLKSVSDTK